MGLVSLLQATAPAPGMASPSPAGLQVHKEGFSSEWCGPRTEDSPYPVWQEMTRDRDQQGLGLRPEAVIPQGQRGEAMWLLGSVTTGLWDRVGRQRGASLGIKEYCRPAS